MPQTEAKGLTLTTVLSPELGTMLSDQRRVDQILLNLLNNAIKFTDQGHVTLTAEPVQNFHSSPDLQPQPAVRLSVTDTGIGIKPDDLDKLFQPFRQIDSGLPASMRARALGWRSAAASPRCSGEKSPPRVNGPKAAPSPSSSRCKHPPDP